MMTSLYEWKVIEWDVKHQKKPKQTNKNVILNKRISVIISRDSKAKYLYKKIMPIPIQKQDMLIMSVKVGDEWKLDCFLNATKNF